MMWSIVYITAVLSANYTAIWFVPLPIFGYVAVGTMLFGATFTARDYVHKLGRPKVYLMIAISALGSAVLSVAGATHWRIIMASVIAICLAESADTEVYHRLLARPWLVRVTGSNLISIPLDTALFNLLAFGGVFPWPAIVAIVSGEIIVKFLAGAIVAAQRINNG